MDYKHVCPFAVAVVEKMRFKEVECNWVEMMRTGKQKCDKCGWFPIVSERRLEKIREQLEKEKK